MKIYFTLLYLIINAVVADATTQTAVNQDKPPRLYVKSYSVTHNESFEESGTLLYLYSVGWPNPYWVEGTDVFDNVDSYTESRNFQDGGAGSWSQHCHRHDVSFSLSTSTTADEQMDVSWLSCNWQNMLGTETDVLGILSLPDWVPYYESNFVTTVSSNLTVLFPQEQCSINLSGTSTYVPTDPNDIGGLVTRSQTVSRFAQTVLKFQTGGKAVSNNKNVFGLSGNAWQVHHEPTDPYWSAGNLYSVPYEGWAVTSNTVVPPTDIRIGSYGSLNKNGVLYVNLAAGADVDVTPDVAGVDYCTFNLNQTEVKTKADWQQVVQYEIDNDSGVQIENYLAGDGFLTNRVNLQAVFNFYGKLFTNNPDTFYWCGLAKLVGAPVYAGLSDAEYAKTGTLGVGVVSGNLITEILTTSYLAPKMEQFQQIMLQMNIHIFDDMAWQFEAYNKCGLNALEEVAVADPQDVDLSTWQEIDDGIQNNDLTEIQDGNQLLAQREQQVTIKTDYQNLQSLLPNTGIFSSSYTNTVGFIVSYLGQNPIIGGPSFWSFEPFGADLTAFDYRWDWTIRTGTGINQGIIPLWLAESDNTRSLDASQSIMTRALQFSYVCQWLGLPLF